MSDDDGRFYGCKWMRCALRNINRAAYVFVKISAAYAAPGNLNRRKCIVENG
jgi:hypothetical protein